MQEELQNKVARWQNLIPSFPWIAAGWRAWGRNPRKGRDHILQWSVAKPESRNPKGQTHTILKIWISPSGNLKKSYKKKETKKDTFWKILFDICIVKKKKPWVDYLIYAALQKRNRSSTYPSIFLPCYYFTHNRFYDGCQLEDEETESDWEIFC